MGKLSLVEKMVSAYQRGEQMPLRGHAKIVLRDALTGKVKEEVEEHNMVTNAVAKILSRNYALLTDYTKTLPLRSLFGGCLLWQDPLTEDADAYDVPSELNNTLIAHAGDTPSDNASLLRGSPVFPDYEINPTSIKQVWLWGTTVGNGTISAVSLCGSKLGNCGTKPFDDSISLLSDIAMSNRNGLNSATTLNRNWAMKFPCSISSDGQTGKAIWWSGTTFEEITVRHDWFKFGIMRNINDWQEVSSRSATVRSFTESKSSFFQDDDYYYLYEVTSATTIKIDKVSKTDMSVTQADITYSGISLYTGNLYHNSWIHVAEYFAFDGTYLYLYNSTRTGIIKVNPADNSDVVVLDGTLDELPYWDNGYKSGANHTPIVISEGLVLGNGYIANGNVAYNIGKINPLCGSHPTDYPHRQKFALIKDGSAVYGNGMQWTTGNNLTGQGAVLAETFMSTIANIQAVTKTTSMTMELIYTLNEV